MIVSQPWRGDFFESLRDAFATDFVFCCFFLSSVIFFAKDNAELKSLIAQAWGLLAQCQYAVQDAVACTKSCQVEKYLSFFGFMNCVLFVNAVTRNL
jgi:hypothetical protein